MLGLGGKIVVLGGPDATDGHADAAPAAPPRAAHRAASAAVAITRGCCTNPGGRDFLLKRDNAA